MFKVLFETHQPLQQNYGEEKGQKAEKRKIILVEAAQTAKQVLTESRRQIKLQKIVEKQIHISTWYKYAREQKDVRDLMPNLEEM